MAPDHRWLLVPIALLAACGGSDSTNGPGNDGGTGNPTPVQAATVSVRNNSFSPEVSAVVIGGTVTWTWAGSNHNVTSVLSPAFSPGSSGTHDTPFTFGPVTFNTAGTYRFICSIHGSASGNSIGGMSGSIIVQ